LPLLVYGFKDIVSFHLNLSYDPHLMEFTGFKEVYPDITSGIMIHPELINGKLEMDWSQQQPVTIPDSGQLIQLVFKTLSAGKSLVALGDPLPGDNIFMNSDHQLIKVIYSEGKAEIIQPALIEIVGEKVLSWGDNLELLVMTWTGNPAEYEWTNPALEHSGGFSYQIDHVTQSDEGYYLVHIIDRNGCMSVDTALVSIGPMQLGRIEVPNAFTPNGDELNDDFLAYTNIDTKFEFKMLVFNKWGQQIFESNDIQRGWDGTYKGELCQPDLYTWIIKFEVPGYIKMDQSSPLKGVVMLVR
jgi:gliding motility-associated-like protein